MFFFYFKRKESSHTHQINPQAVIRRLMPFSRPDKSGFLADGGGGLMVQCLHWNTVQSRLEPAPLYHAPSETTAASWARLDNRDELGKKLGMDSAKLDEHCDTELILFSYLKWQDACIEHLIGDFVFVIHDHRRQRIFCGRDHMGVRPLYYFVSDNAFVCATSPGALLHLECVPISIASRWVAEYLIELSMSFDRTPYEEIKKLPPAHCLTVTPKQISLRRYFELSAEPTLKLRDSREYVDAYREQLERAIKCRLKSYYAVGAELSGGIDSSTITAYAARFLDQTPSRLSTFSFSFFELEPHYIQSIITTCGLPNCHIIKEQDTQRQAALQRSLNILGYPVEHRNATFHEPFYRLAEGQEIRTLLSGFGGDEFVTTLHGYLVPLEMLLQRRLRELYNILPGNALFRFLRLIKMELRRRKTDNFTTPAFSPRFYQGYKMRWRHRIVRDELTRRYSLETRYFDETRFDSGYTDLKRFTLEKRWRPFVPTRMENCTLMAASRKIEYRWPLLDIRLVRLFLNIPSEENYYRGMGRYLHRRAIDGIVPKMVTWKQGKDMGSVINQDLREDGKLLQFSLSDLHPALEEYIDMEKLRLQIGQMSRLREVGAKENQYMQFRRNIQAVQYLSAWMTHIGSPLNQ